MEIANIVTDYDLNIGPEFNVTNSLDEIILTNIPTLIIGYEWVCDIYGKENINVLERKISDNIFWTFKRNEKRDLLNSDLEDFIRLSYRRYTDKLNYVDVDVIQYSNNKLRKIVKKILSTNDFISYESDSSIIYSYSGNLIFGMDLNTMSYVGLDIDKIRNKIKERSVKYFQGNDILLEYSNHLDRLDNDIKLIPFLYSINPTQ